MMPFSKILLLFPSAGSLISGVALLLWNKVFIKIVWLLAGTNRKIKAIKDGKETVSVAQVDRIISRPNDAFIIPSQDKYFGWNEGFISLRDLSSRNITLHSVSLKNQTVSFAEFDGDYDPYETEKNPFLWMSQFHLAKRIIKVPLRVFLSMTAAVDPSSMRVVFLHHTARCGSTLWSQIFNRVPDCAVISECMSLWQIIEELDDVTEFVESDEFLDIAGAVIKFHMSRFPDKKMLFVKATLGDFYTCRVISKICPDHRILFGYRDPLPSGRSFYQISNLSHDSRFFHTVLKLWFNCPLMASQKKMYSQGSRPHDQVAEQVRPQDSFEWYMLLWCLCTTVSNQALQCGVNIKGLKYERLTEDPKKAITKLFEFIGTDMRYVEDAVKAMQIDSQKNSAISHKMREKAASWKSTADGVERCNKILNSFGFPSLHDKYTFPNDFL